ncbi:hypothetical protein [Aneurinibacillus tyrosinisolvens]|uniref:hypothetical protein n=1 Tax=Aneurinibacillus tyrosinisolvens TaxID=1443435 RepID=UPI000B0EFF91|nr:hypothetical protein [Aneurinibacillus tyrosinisolvens]
MINGKTAGATYDAKGNVITDPSTSKPFVSTSPDSNSLIKVGDKLYLVNHYEGISGTKTIGNLPKSMALNTVEQDKNTGKLTVTDMKPIDFSADGGIWTPCAGSLSPMPDNRTVYMGDDGSYTMMFMYVADKTKDLSAGTLYAARWKQTGDQNGGSANLEWVKL